MLQCQEGMSHRQIHLAAIDGNGSAERIPKSPGEGLWDSFREPVVCGDLVAF